MVGCIAGRMQHPGVGGRYYGRTGFGTVKCLEVVRDAAGLIVVAQLVVIFGSTTGSIYKATAFLIVPSLPHDAVYGGGTARVQTGQSCSRIGGMVGRVGRHETQSLPGQAFETLFSQMGLHQQQLLVTEFI